MFIFCQEAVRVRSNDAARGEGGSKDKTHSDSVMMRNMEECNLILGKKNLISLRIFGTPDII